MFLADKWQDYEVIDTSSGEKLERWGDYTLIRPDPQVIWETPKTDPRWNTANARYHRSDKGGGSWEIRALPEVWQIGYGSLVFAIKPMGFKHTGIFPEQAYNWDYCGELIKNAGRPVSVLNLFAYTGGATLAAAAAGASVCHVDASKGMVAWARENAALSGLSQAPIRYIVDDCRKFVERELRRGKKYDAVIMDPPSYGRGPSGELWKLEQSIYPFVELVADVLSDEPLFFLVNSYTTGLSPSVMAYILGKTVGKRFGGTVFADELGLPVTGSPPLPAGASAYWRFS
ncbi:MAG TPA: class I SAM-dependent methyltransferase [Terriglobales bacterium]|nr:class I SAM-dependent methyltransferase [Terriglobales bacterium]